MRTNVLNDLSNVVKKGTGLACSWSQVGRMSEGAPDEHPMSIRSASDGERWKPAGEKGSTRVWKHVAMIFAVLTLSIANIGVAWGANFTPAQIVASGGTTTSNIKVSSSYTSVATGKKLCSSQTKVDAVSIAGNANNNQDANYVEIQATSGTISTLQLKVRGNSDGTGAIVIVFWSGNAQTTYTSYSTSYNYIAREGSDCDGLVNITVPSNTKTVRLYKGIYVKDGAFSNASGKTTVSAGGTYNIFGITATSSASCPAADLTAANITSNGDQVVGTGITFSKVGTPASGDTWYWQTSATGTDKTYNASSSYTTATVAGNYTVYLRAYNSASDCWGTAISKTNTIFCSNVYNGENVDKGNKTASGWTINSSTSMTKTSGSSNGYSYWYQASGSSSNYVQFDGSISLVSGDKIIIRWTHTSAGKSLALTINGSSASLTSGGTVATANTLMEAVYDVSSATNVTSIKLNSSGSSGCIIYQVSIVKAACSPSCGETAQAALTLSSNSGTICGTGTATFTVSGGSGTGELSVSSSDETKATASIDGTTVTVTGVAAGSATITVTKACDATYAEKTATYSATVAAIPTANAGSDKTTELGNGVALAATAAASGCTGAWTIQSGPNTSTAQLSSTSSATATFTPTVAGTYTLRWTVTNSTSGCSAYDEMTVKAAICSISDCGNATLTYPLNVGTSLINTAANLVNTPSNGGSAALTVPAASAAVTLSTITISEKDGKKDNYGKAAAATSACYPTTAPTMSSKIGMYNGSSYSLSNYLQFAFTVNSGYTFTPCDIQFTVQPVSNEASFRWEVTDGTNIYGYGTGNAPVGTGNGATVLTGLGSTAEMEAGTYYIRLYPYYNGSNTFRISNDVILKGTTASAAPSCTAPNHVDISGNYHFFPGETLALTATAYSTAGTSDPIAAGDITGYQWQKYIGSDWEDIVGETSATYTKANATTSDVGQYRCIVSTGATCSTTSGTFNAKCLQLYVYWDNKSDKCNLPFTKVDGTHATVNVSLENGSYTYYYKVTDGCGNWWGNTGTMTSGNCSGWNLNVNSHCGLTTTKAAAYTFNLTYNAGVDAFSMSVVYPSSVQVGGYNLYFANDERNWSNIHYRIGRSNWNSKAAMTLVPGTANLYQTTTIHYESDGGFEAWHIANNGGWSDGNSIYKTKTGDGNAITNATSFEGAPVPSTGLTVIPGSDHSTGGDAQNNNCEFYSYTTVPGMLRDRVTITAPVNGTITVNYTSEENVASSFSATTVDMNQDLAHTVIITPTVTPAEGYTLSGLTVNGAAHTSGNTYTVTANTTIAATFSPASYTVTLNTNGGTINAGNVTSYTYGTGATLPTNVTKDGFTFGGWYDNSGLTGSAVTTISTTATGNKEYWAKWTAAASLTALECNTLYTPADMLPSGKTISSSWQYDANGLSGNTKFFIVGNGGDKSTAEADAGIVEIKTGSAVTISGTGYSNYCYFKMAPQMSGTTPTSKAIKFILSGSGSLDVYGKGVLALVKEGGSPTTKDCTSTPSKVTWDNLTAGTYYLYATGTSRYMVAMQFNCCTTPAVPTGFTAGSITSTGATFTITDAAGAASYDIYYSTSSTAPTASTAATTTSTSKTKAVTGLTASTTYYAWVRSVCDADHKSAWVALSGSSFTTTAAGPEALIYWIVTVDASTWSLNGSPTTTDGTNITSISSSIDAASSPSTGASGTTAKVALAAASDNVSNAASFTFTVNSAKKVEPERVTCQVFNVGSGSGDQLSYKAQLSDNNGHVYYSTNSVKPASAATLTDATFTFASDLVLTGNVTLKVYGYQDGGTKGTAFRMGADVKLFGEVQNAADYTVTHTMSNVTKSAGATSVKEGNNYTATYAGAGGYALPSTITVTIGGSPATAGTDYTWTQGTGVVTIPGNKVTGNIVITVTGVAVVNYSITYHCNGAESGCPSNVAATTNLPSPLPTGMTKDGYDFGGWFTDSECTVAAVAGAALTGNTDLYAKWTERGSGCEDTPHAWDVIATGAKSYKVRISKVTEEVAIPVADATASNLTAYAGSVSTNDNVTVQIADGGSSQYGYKFDGSNTYLKLVFSTPLVLNDTLVVGMTNASHNISFTTTAVRSTTLSTSGGKLIIPAALAGQSTLYLWRGSGSTMYLRSFAVKHECEAIPSCTTPTLPTATLSNQTVCEGSDIAAWDATPTNASTISSKSESIAYSWKKKGNDTELANTTTFDLGSSATESQAGTYVVTVTVSKTGYASSTATKEVTLSVTDGEEVTSITADKATVYPGNSVTLTATANTPATWQWYTCTNAEGDGEAIISGAESASFTIASAGAAGTYYYKAKATGDCGTGSMVYTLTVSAAAGGDCETEFWFAYDSDRPEGAAAATHITTALTAGSTASASITIDGNTYAITKRSSNSTGPVTIVIPEGNTGTVYVLINGSNSRSLTLTKGGVSQWSEVPVGWTSYSITGLDEGTYTLSGSGNLGWGLVALKLCSGTACTDPEVTASVNNSTACVGSSVTFTATGAHASATYQWQKYSGGAWTNISGSGATASTYTIASVVAGDAGKYRVIASHDCNRTSNEVTLSVPSVPNFGSTVPASVSVMQTIALSINTVEATDAVKYRWYKSADATWDAGDTEIGTNKELIKAYDGEAIGTPSYYIFCRAQNACGIATSTAIAVNVTAYVEEDCATRGNESDAEFGFQNSGCGQGSYQSANCYTMNSNSKILVYSAPDGKYFKTMKVTIASSSATKASYNWSTNGGSSYTADGVAITGVTTTLTEKTIDLSAHGNVNEVKIGRNFGNGESSGTLYLSKICFEYTDACTATTVTPSTSSVNYEMDGGSFTEPTFTVKHGGTAFDPQPTLTYSSSNEDIASVDDDGTVTFNGEAGTVTITASYAGGTISATEYCASSGSYIINVSCPGGAPKVVADGSVNMSGCNSSVTLNAKTQVGADFADGTYQWFRNGEEIDGATSSSYTATQAGTYTVERTNTSGCTTPSTNSAVVTSETTEPEVERLVPFQYYHVDSIYRETSIMRFRHLFAVKNSGKLDGKSFKMYVSRNGGAATDVTSSNALVVVPNGDGHVDTVMVDLNNLRGKYSENDELVFTCKAIDCSNNVSDVYKNTITMNVIGSTPTLALICSGSSKAGGTRKTGELTVGGDFLTGYNVADLCQQTGNTSFDANTEWGLYTRLKENYIVTPVNGYAVFNKLNYEPFDILLLTDYPKASKSDAAATVLDDMADLCDYRPMLSFKAHMVSKSPSKWAAKGFTTSPVVPKNTRTRLNIVCYAHPMFSTLKSTATHIQKDNDDPSQIVYTMLTGAGYESSKGLQGFELEAAENFVTIGLVHYNATPTDGSPSEGYVTWAPGSEDRMLVTAVERQENPEARMIMFAVNCGAQSKFTETGRNVVLKCLEYLLTDATITPMADCSFTFDNGAGNTYDAATQASKCPSCTGTKGDGKWSTAANWGPDYVVRPGKDTEVKIAAPVTVDPAVGDGAADNFTPKVRSVRILEGGQVTIPAGSYLEVVSTIRRQDGSDIYPTEENDIHIGSGASGNGTLIFNNNSGDTKARVDMYSNAKADMVNMSATTSTWQYIGTPYNDVASATHNYYDSWLYQYSGSGWEVIPNGGPLVPFRGYCVTHPDAPVVFSMEGTLAATTSQDIAIPAGYTVIANSWVAPIDINAITDDDMEGITDKTIYFFNTGTDADGTAGTGTAAGTYRATPIHSSSYTGDWQIPSMQGFYVSTTTAGTFHLDYERHVRPAGSRTTVDNPMYAPRRAAAESDDPNVLKIFARGSRYQDKLVVLEREDFTRGYDSGWDGEAWGGSNLSPMVYVTGEGREDAVSAIPEFEGTVVAFKAGEDSEYRFEFIYDGDESLYLFDTENNTYTQIMTGESYFFSTDDKAPHSRFILTRKAPQIATGVEPTSDGEGAKARKLLIEDKMYILLNGMLYDATGKVVK